MASDEMLGNLKTQELIRYSQEHNIATNLNHIALQEAYRLASINITNS
jgi:hypothetical protein